MKIILRRHIIRIGPLLLLVTFLTIGPIILLIISSFGTQNVPGVGTFELTSKNYQAVIGPEFQRSFVNTIVYAVFKTLGSVTLGTIVAWLAARTNVPMKKFMEFTSVLPILVPFSLTAMGIAFLLAPRSGLLNVFFRDTFHIEAPLFNVFSMEGMVLVGIMNAYPLTFLVVHPAMLYMNQELEDAARITGSNTLSSFFRVTLPIVSPALLITGLINLIRGIESVTPALYLGQTAGINVLGTEIYKAVQLEAIPRYGIASALGVVMLTLAAVLLFFYRKATAMQRKYVTITGKTPRVKILDIGPFRYVAVVFVVALFGLTTLAPLGLIVLESLLPFSMAYSWNMFPMLTLRNTTEILSDPTFTNALTNTLAMVVVGSVVAMTLGIVIGYTAIRTKLPGRGILHSEAIFPLAIPSIVIGLALIWTYARTPIYATIWILILAMIIKHLPSSIAMTSNTMYQIEPELEESSRTCGSSWLRTFRSIMLPLLTTSFFSGTIYMIMRTVGELDVVLLLRGAENEVLATWMWTEWGNGSFQRATPIGLTMLLLNIALFISFRAVERRFAAKLVVFRT